MIVIFLFFYSPVSLSILKKPGCCECCLWAWLRAVLLFVLISTDSEMVNDNTSLPWSLESSWQQAVHRGKRLMLAHPTVLGPFAINCQLYWGTDLPWIEASAGFRSGQGSLAPGKLYPSSVKLLHGGNEQGKLIHALALLWKDNSCFPCAKCSRYIKSPQVK